MSKSGQARVLTDEQQNTLFEAIKEHRHPEKNTAIMQVSFKLGLRAQEIALLQIKEVARLSTSSDGFDLLEVMSLPAAYTKGANASGHSTVGSNYQRRVISFDVGNFDNIVRQIETMAKADCEINPKDFYPPVKTHKGKSRNLPMVNTDLREALTEHLRIRISSDPDIKPSSPLFVTQKGGPYSPNTLQDHMALMLRGWAKIEKASSHSGRRTLITDVIHRQKKSIKVAQLIAGHKSASTTVIYDDPPEAEVGDALNNVGKENKKKI